MTGTSRRFANFAAVLILVCLEVPVALAQDFRRPTAAMDGTLSSLRSVREQGPRRFTASSAYDPFSDQPTDALGAYVVRPGWTIIPDFILRETYTDNIGLTSSQTSDDFITELNPGIQVLGDTRRIAFELNYNLQHLVYANNPDFNDTFHRLFSTANTELIERIFFLDAGATITQQNAINDGPGTFSNFGPGAILSDLGDNINPTGDREDVTTYSISPYVRHRFGDFADAESRFTYDSVSTSDTDSNAGQIAVGRRGSDSRSLNYHAEITSGSRYVVFPWSLTYDNRQIDYDRGDTTEFEQILGRMEYVYNPIIRFIGDLGYESNSFASREPLDDTIIWDIGGRWTPSARTQLEATYGERFFGNRYTVNLTHQSRRATWHLRYDEEQDTVRDRQLELAVRSRGIDITPVDPRTGEPTLPSGGVPTQTNEVFIRRLFSSGLVLEGDRNQVSLFVFDENRDFLSGGGSESLFGTDAIWIRSINPLTDFRASFGWTTVDDATELTGTSVSDDLFNIRVELSRQLGRNLSTSLGFRRIERTSDDITREFAENRIFGQIRVAF
ncbi:MAG: TIGR03016 family PEP-CTERM system-associated outer membrane protein [Nitrososphaera sp.]|nr:TIGR03016 family PEP-CTERM system-associated outer membrane protein [Nitrososphaera sp.]